jgi:hypothetical protein
MARQIPPGIAFGFSIALALAFSLAISPDTWGSVGDLVGIVDAKGHFQPKARVTKEGAVLRVKKTNPRDKFDALRIRFVFPGRKKAGAMDDLFIQWEKKPNRWGRLWRLGTHRGYDAKTGMFEAPWKTSLSFRILDKSRRSRFKDLPWNRIVRIRLDGKKLLRKPVPERAAEPVTPSPPASPAPQVTPEARSRPVAPPQPVRPAPVPTIDSTAQKALESKYRDLRERVRKLEHEVEVAQQWFYWGPLVALTLSILFCSVALFLTFMRVRHSDASRRLSPPSHSPTRSRSHSGFRRTG